MYIKFLKRFMDIFLSLTGIIVLSVPMVIVAVLVKRDSEGPVFFVQKRVGLHKKEFNIIKFRTMSIDAPVNLPQDELLNAKTYMTAFQEKIRKASIDELPQLFCVLKGDMSVVGPRPVLKNEACNGVKLIDERAKYGANDIKPGVTGWAQINGRNELSVEEKARYDGVYVEKIGFWFDLKCLLLTVGYVIRKEGVKINDQDPNETNCVENATEK